jgi:hypothetical protein
LNRLLFASLLLGACNDIAPGGTTETKTGKPWDDVDPQSILKLPMNLSVGGGLSLDPIESTNPTDIWVHYLLYDTLLRQREDGGYEP